MARLSGFVHLGTKRGNFCVKWLRFHGCELSLPCKSTKRCMLAFLLFQNDQKATFSAAEKNALRCQVTTEIRGMGRCACIWSACYSA